MFTGIIQEVGEIISIEEHTFEVRSKKAIQNKKIGESIAVNGACMTITEITADGFRFQAVQESLYRTNFKHFSPGTKVNLEAAMRLDQGIDGHLVQGHVDCEAEVESLEENILTIKHPQQITKYLAFKGSITVNGVSLTIAKLTETNFSIALIPKTLEETNLSELKPGDTVNLEVDLIARYLKRMLDSKEAETKYQYLKERGFI